MYIRGRRGIGALVMLAVLVMGALAVLPMGALGQTNQIVGTVSDCAGSFVDGALVVLTDANGYQAPKNMTTGIDGVFSFTPAASGSFNLRVTRSGFFANETTSPLRFDGTTTVSHDFCLAALPGTAKNLTVTVIDGVSSAVLSGANVQAVYLPLNQIAATGTTNASGMVDLALSTATYELRTTRSNYSVKIDSVNVASVSTFTVAMVSGGVLQGHARDRAPTGPFLSAGLQGFLYNTALPNTSGLKVIRADIFGSLYRFHAPSGSYRMVIDANGFQSFVGTVFVPVGSAVLDVVLQPSPKEVYSTTVAYGAADWNNLTVYRNLTLNPDTNLSGLNPDGLRDLRLQVDFTMGNGNGVIDGSEGTAFHDWFVRNGPFYVTTDGFFTTNGKSYLSATSYSVNVDGLAAAGSKVWINTTVTYALKQAPPYIAVGAKTYFVNVTLIGDSNVSAYRDFVYLVSLPKKYELNTSTTAPPGALVTTANFTRVTIDPGLTSLTPQLRMVISQSLNGTARAKVIGPAGKFYVDNATFQNYRVFVANNTTLTFSGADSTDPNGHVVDGNFTWQFTTTDTRYGIEPQYKYLQNGTYTVNLTFREAGGNISLRNITVFVDDQLPHARIRTNRTGGGAFTGTLRVDEGIVVRIDGGLSTDLAYPGKDGKILDSGYSWDFDGDRVSDATGRVVNWTFRKPGQFTVNLTVTDSVGWKSTNATMTARVNDTKAPVPAFDILDPSKDWGIITSPMERKTISLNASKSTDDYDKIATLNFTWTIPGPIVGLPGNNHTFYGVNATFAWQEWNTTYNVTLSVRDSGFGSGKPNWGNTTRKITVQIDVTIHADLRIDAGTMKVSPADPEEGAPVTVSVNVTNKAGRATASNVTTQLFAITSGQTTLVAGGASWFDKNGIPKADHTILSGETVKLVFTAGLSGQGNKTLRVVVSDSTEPYTWITAENRASSPVSVRQPWWQPWAIAGSVIGVIVLFVFGMYARRKIKAGEWRPIRGRRGERGEGEEKKPRKEVKEEKKRL